MRFLKLVIWDLDETILTGIFQEGDEEVSPVAHSIMEKLNERGILQALATHNPSSMISVLRKKYSWFDLFTLVEADLGSKARMVGRIFNKLEVHSLDAVLVDEDAFERDSIQAQIPGITALSISELNAYLDSNSPVITEEARKRPRMYRDQQARVKGEKTATDYLDFLRSCNIHITIRPFISDDMKRSQELLTRTHKMNLGVLPIEDAIDRLNQPDEHKVIIAEMEDTYGDMGRCGILQLTHDENNGALIESLAISCRSRARGLSLAMFVGLLSYPRFQFQKYLCRYISNDYNRPLRMLLLGIGFKPVSGTELLTLDAKTLPKLELPDWVNITYKENYIN